MMLGIEGTLQKTFTQLLNTNFMEMKSRDLRDMGLNNRIEIVGQDNIQKIFTLSYLNNKPKIKQTQ
jgi:hypothetical protein